MTFDRNCWNDKLSSDGHGSQGLRVYVRRNVETSRSTCWVPLFSIRMKLSMKLHLKWCTCSISAIQYWLLFIVALCTFPRNDELGHMTYNKYELLALDAIFPNRAFRPCIEHLYSSPSTTQHIHNSCIPVLLMNRKWGAEKLNIYGKHYIHIQSFDWQRLLHIKHFAITMSFTVLRLWMITGRKWGWLIAKSLKFRQAANNFTYLTNKKLTHCLFRAHHKIFNSSKWISLACTLAMYSYLDRLDYFPQHYSWCAYCFMAETCSITQFF